MLHVYARTYTISFHVFLIWYIFLFVEIWFCVIFFNIYVQFRLKQLYGRNSYSKCVHMLTMETGG